MPLFYRISLLPVSIALVGLLTAASESPNILDLHRSKARELMAVLGQGTILRGEVKQNGSSGSFEAYFHEGDWLIVENFGAMQTRSYSGPEGVWTGGNFCLPYELEPTDSPANTMLNMLSSGAYLEDEHWSSFSYVGQQAGGYKCRFTSPGLPDLDIVLYGDEEEPEFLQIMSAELAIAPNDPRSIRHRSFYHYSLNPDGQLYTSRETGKDIDQDGMTVSVNDYIVKEFVRTGSRPPELNFDTSRSPVGGAGAGLSEAIKVPVETGVGYFIVPLTFADGSVHKFILDTGASASLFAPGAVAAANFATDVVTMAYGHGSKQEFELGMVNGAALGVAASGLAPLMPFPATKIPSSSRDVLDALAAYGCSGILGVAPLHQYVVTLDYAEKLLLATPQQLFDPATTARGPFLTFTIDAEDLIYVKARINDSLIGNIVLDTGLQQDLALLRETMDGAGLNFEKVGESLNTVVGGKKQFDFVSVPSFDLGPLRLEGKIATLTEDDRGSLAARKMLGFLGLSLFTQARVTLDLFAQRMYVEPPAQLIGAMQQADPGLFTGVVDDRFAGSSETAPASPDQAPEDQQAEASSDDSAPAGTEL